MSKQFGLTSPISEGIKIILNENLPSQTMIVSKDVYLLFKELPERKEEKLDLKKILFGIKEKEEGERKR